MPKKRSLSQLSIRERAQFILKSGLKVVPVLNPQTMKMQWQAFCGKTSISDLYEDDHKCLTDTLAALRRQAGEGYEQTIERNG